MPRFLPPAIFFAGGAIALCLYLLGLSFYQWLLLSQLLLALSWFVLRKLRRQYPSQLVFYAGQWHWHCFDGVQEIKLTCQPRLIEANQWFLLLEVAIDGRHFAKMFFIRPKDLGEEKSRWLRR